MSPLFLPDIGCRAAMGYNGNKPNEVFDSIWKPFSARMVRRVEGDALMGYYRDWHVPQPEKRFQQVGTLIARADGQCNSWAYIFSDVLYMQGLQTDRQTLTGHAARVFKVVPSQASKFDGFLVNNWNFGMKPFVDITKKIKQDNTIQDEFTLGKGNTYDFVGKPPVSPGKGIMGQGGTEPAKAFTNHLVFVLFNNKVFRIYDPSYGTNLSADNATKALEDFQKKSLAGFYSVSNGKGNKTVEFAITREKDANGLKLVFTNP